MSKNNTILIIFISFFLIVGGLLFFYFSKNQQPTNQPSITVNDPFGNIPGDRTPNIPSTGTSTTSQGSSTSFGNVFSTLKQIYKNPTSGSIFTTDKNNLNILKFVDRAVGHTYEYPVLDQTGGPTRITNTTIPKIQEVVWSSTGIELVYRFLDGETDNISSFSSKIKPGETSSTETTGEITGLFLTSNIKQLVINPAGNKIFSLIDKSDKSGTFGITTNLDGSGKKVIFDSPASYWNISWPKDNIITFTTKPNNKDYGILYFLNIKENTFDRIISNHTGLSTITNKEASLVAYSYSENEQFVLDIYDVTKKLRSNINITTISDKCVWGELDPKILYCAIPKIIAPNKYPDVWYQGVVSFNDNIWKINTETGAMEELYQIGSNENAEIDAIDLKISKDDSYLAFTNKKDLSLWLLKIK
jgi:hypothetical protein